MPLTKINVDVSQLPIAVTSNNVRSLSDYNDLLDALSQIATEYSSENDEYTLVIDVDVDLTGLSAQIITIPEYLTTVVRKGKKFITPLVDRDVTGVADTDKDITLLGTSGTAIITIKTNTYTVTFNTDLTTTASDFVTAEAANILADTGLTVIANAGVLEFNGHRKDFGNDFAITNDTGDLDGASSIYTFNRNSIVGTVADNYIQLQINGSFEADNNIQCFDGDGLVWFGKDSVDEVWATWWGLEGRTFNGLQNQTTIDLNVKAFQQSVNCVVMDKVDRATSKLKLPNGNIYLDRPINFYASPVDGHPYLTGNVATDTVSSTVIQLEGAERIKHEINFRQTTNIFYTANWGAPLIFQGLRNSSIKNIRIEGQNDINARNSEWRPSGLNVGGNVLVDIVLRPDRFESYDIEQIGWISRNINWGNKRPYAGIITDLYRVQYEFSKITTVFEAGSTLDLYLQETTPSHQNSWDVQFESMHIRKFVEGLAIGIQGQQNDTYVFKDVMVQGLCFGISIAQDQSRDCKVYELIAYSGVYAMFETSLHGDGIMPEVISAHSAGGLKYLQYGGSADGITNFSNVYVELFYGLGVQRFRNGYFRGGASGDNESFRTGSNFGASITNSTLKHSGAGDTYTTSEGTSYLLRPPTVDGFNFYNVSINGYDNNPVSVNTWAFQACNFYGCSMGENRRFFHPIDYGWFGDNYPRATLSRGVKLGGSSNNLGKPPSAPTFYNNGSMLNRGGNYPTNNIIGRSIEDMLIFKDMETSSNTVTMFVDRFVMTIDKTIDNRHLEVGDYVRVEKSSINTMGIIVSNDETTIEIAKFSEYEWLTLLGEVDGSSQMTGVNIRKAFFGASFRPFCGDFVNGSNTFSVVADAEVDNSNVGFGKIERGNWFPAPDGRIYFVLDYTGSTITLDRNYQGSSETGKWCEPYKKSFKPARFVRNYNNSNYYSLGETYPYYDFAGVATNNIVKCVKAGKYDDATSVNYNAKFLKYNKDFRLRAYIDGVTNSEIVIRESGTTAQRIDNVGVPLEYIPNGFVYDNTEAVETQVFNGTAFVTI